MTADPKNIRGGFESMRNLKKLLAVVVAICVLATFTVPAFAETKTADQICTDLGMLKGAGSGVTAEYLATQPDRLQGAILFLRLKGLEDAAKAFVGTDNFADVAGLNDTNTAILAYLKANPDLGFGGVGDNKFSPLTKMSAKEYYKVLLVALGYEYEKDFTWANVFSFAASKGLTALIDNEAFTVKDLATGTVEALKATVKGGTDTLVAKLVEGGSITAAAATASGLYTATPKALEVVSATADTLKTAKIVFNQELNSDTVKTDNFTGPTLKTNGAKLLDDKKTVILVLQDAKSEQSKTEDITIKNVKSASGTVITEVKKTVTFVDNTIPVISGAVAKNAKTIVISASEPMKMENPYTTIFDKIKIDGSSAIASSTTVDYTKNTVTLNLASLLATGSHKIEIAGMTDFANYTAVTQTFSFDVAADTVAPEITAGKVNNPNEIQVTFNEDVDRMNKGSFKINGEDAKTVTQDADDASKFTLGLTTALTVGATVEVNVKYKDQKDVVGNTTAEKTFTFKVADDTTLPTVTASIASDNKITLTFSKDVLKTSGKVKVYKEDGTTQIGGEIPLSGQTWDSATVCKIDPNAGDIKLNNTDSKNIKIKITEVKDATVRANALAETVISLTANDTKKPEVRPFYTFKAGTATDKSDDTVTIYFSEAMNADTLKNLSNYSVVTGTALSSYTALQSLASYNDVSIKEVASDNKSVVIKAKNIAAAATGSSLTSGLAFRVDAVKDIAGNMAAATSVTLYQTSAPVVTTVQAIATNKIEIYFDNTAGKTNPAECAPGTFILREASATGTDAAIIIATSIDGNKVTATLDRDIATDLKANGNAIYYATLKNDLTKNSYGDAMTSGSGVVIDKVKPTVKGFTATNGGILIEFSENVTATEDAFLAQELVLTKGGDPVTVTPGSISYADKNGVVVTAGAITPNAVGSKYIVINNLVRNTEYKIQLVPKGVLTDVSANHNWFVATEVKAVTTN
jgi:hypothetical protein